MNVDLALTARNNLFRGQLLFLNSIEPTAGLWMLKDNLFDKVAFADYWMFVGTDPSPLDHGFNAYYRRSPSELQVMQTDRLKPDASTDILLTSAPPYEAGPLGAYYLATSSPLYDSDKRGSRSVADAGLYHYTTRVNQTKDGAQTGNAVIGRHYVATTSQYSSQPKDYDSDGIPDYVENWHGDADFNSHAASDSETNWEYPETVAGVPDALHTIYDDVDLDGDGMVGRIEKALGTDTLVPFNPLTMTKLITGDEPDILRFTLPISYTVLEQLGTISLFANGHSVTLETCDAAAGGNTLITWNSTYEPSGQLFLNPALVLSKLPPHAKVTHAPGPIHAFYSPNVARFSTATAQFDENGVTLYARLPQANANYSIEICDAENPSTPIKTISSGSTSDGAIQETWNFIQDDEETVFSGDRILVAFNVSLLDNPVSGRHIQAINRGSVVVPDGRFDVAFMWHDYALTEPHYGAMWTHMQFVVETLMAPYFGYPHLYQSFFNDYGLTPKPGYVQTRENALALLSDLANLNDSGTRNFFYMGHGSPRELLDGLPGPTRAYLRSSEVAASLGNSFDPVNGIKTEHPYRFVFINGCASAFTKDWCRAFGIFPWDDSSTELSGYRGPQAFVGWPRPVAGPDVASEWDDVPYPAAPPRKGYGSMLEGFYASWMLGLPLIECITRSADPTEYKWPLPLPSNKRIYTKPNDPTQYTAPIVVVGNLGITRSGVAF